MDFSSADEAILSMFELPLLCLSPRYVLEAGYVVMCSISQGKTKLFSAYS